MRKREIKRQNERGRKKEGNRQLDILRKNERDVIKKKCAMMSVIDKLKEKT